MAELVEINEEAFTPTILLHQSIAAEPQAVVVLSFDGEQWTVSYVGAKTADLALAHLVLGKEIQELME